MVAKFLVILGREVEQSAEIELEAATEHEAEKAALALVKNSTIKWTRGEVLAEFVIEAAKEK